MGGGKAEAGLVKEGQDLIGRMRLCEPVCEGAALQKLHGDEDLLEGCSDVEDRDDVGVGQASHGLGFVQQAGTGFGVGTAAHAPDVQELDGDLAVQLWIVRRIDNAHASRAQSLDDHVATNRRALGQVIRGQRLLERTRKDTRLCARRRAIVRHAWCDFTATGERTFDDRAAVAQWADQDRCVPLAPQRFRGHFPYSALGFPI